MKKRFVSAVAVLICCAIFAIVAVIAYSLHRKNQAEEAAFRAQLGNAAENRQAVLAAHMPEQLSARMSAAAPSATPTPGSP